MLRTEWVGCYAKSEHGVGVKVRVKYDAMQIVSTVLRSVRVVNTVNAYKLIRIVRSERFCMSKQRVLISYTRASARHVHERAIGLF